LEEDKDQWSVWQFRGRSIRF